MEYNNQALREFFIEGFNKDELFVFVNDDFKKVLSLWPEDATLTIKVQMLIDYCDHFGNIDKLLKKAQLERQNLFQEYEKKILQKKIYTLKDSEEKVYLKVETNVNWKECNSVQIQNYADAIVTVFAEMLEIPEDWARLLFNKPGSIVIFMSMPIEFVNIIQGFDSSFLQVELGCTSTEIIRINEDARQLVLIDYFTGNLEIDFSNIFLTQTNLHSANLSEANLNKADLSRTNLSFANLRNTDLRYADLRYASLRNANLRGSDLRNAILRDAHLTNANLREVNLSNTNLRKVVLSETDLRKANLSNTDLSEADLSNADLREAYIKNADLREAKLSNADLSDADLSNADLRYADLRYADLSKAILTGTDLRYSILNNTKLDDIIYDETTKWPDNEEGVPIKSRPPV